MSLNTILATTPNTTSGYVLRATGTTIGNSTIQDDGTNVAIGTTPGTYKFNVSGSGSMINIIGASSGDIATGFRIGRGASLGAEIYDNPADNITTFNTTGGLNLRVGGSNRLTIASTGIATFTSTITPLIIRGTNVATMWTEYYYNTSTLSGYIGSGDGLLSGANASDFIVRSQADFVVATGGNNRRLTIASTGAATFSSSVTAAGAIYAGSTSRIGFGTSAAERGAIILDASYNWTINTNGVSGAMSITSATGNVGIGVTPSYKLDVNGVTQIRDTLLVTKQNGFNYPQTSSSGTTSFVNTGIFYNTSIIGFGNVSMYQLVVLGNPNGAGSSEYRAIYLGYIYVTTGYDFGIGNVVQNITYTQLVTGNPNNIGSLSISVVFWNGSTESTQQINGTTNNQIRVKISNYNSGNIGAAQEVRIIKVSA